MSQLLTLIWLKWKLFRNSLRSSKAVVNRIASILGMLAALALASLIALGLGVAAYALTRPHGMMDVLHRKAAPGGQSNTSVEFIFFTILAFSYLIWATLPLSIGSSKQFDPGRMLMYPISLRKLFAIDFISELTTLQSVFAIPGILALGIGAGLGTGEVARALVVTIPAAAFGIALSKWLSTAIGYLTRGKRTRGETLVAVIGAVAGLGGALVGQIAPVIFKHAESVRGLRWTPPGAAAFALTTGLQQDLGGYFRALATLSSYTIVLVVATYWIARRSALAIGGRRRTGVTATVKNENYTGWELPLLSPQIAAVVEKELRYILRNAQVRMMALMPLILVVIRIMNTNRFSKAAEAPDHAVSFTHDFFTYGRGLIDTGGVLYVFLILAGLSCNLFAFEEGGMRTLILSPLARRDVLIGKNIAITVVAAVFSVFLLTINEIVFRGLTPGTVLFIALSFITFAALMSVMGNWFSLRFPKRMQFGKRLNVSGVVGLLIIPMILILALPPLGATAAGYIARSLVVEYVTLAVLALLAVISYLLVINAQGESLERREVEILEAVREPTDE